MQARPGVLAGAVAVLAVALLCSCAGTSTDASGTPSPVGPAAQPAPASSPAPQPQPQPAVAGTRHRTFAPYDASGELTARMSGTRVTGTCWTTSIAVPVVGVYRCLAGNEILDPCFAPAVDTAPPTLACFSDPWSPGTLLRLTGRLPADHPALTDGHPWALRLANDARCVTVTGTVPTLHGLALQYLCGADAVAGLTDGPGAQLHVRYGPSGGPLRDVAVTADWRGRSYRIAAAN